MFLLLKLFVLSVVYHKTDLLSRFVPVSVHDQYDKEKQNVCELIRLLSVYPESLILCNSFRCLCLVVDKRIILYRTVADCRANTDQCNREETVDPCQQRAQKCTEEENVALISNAIRVEHFHVSQYIYNQHVEQQNSLVVHITYLLNCDGKSDSNHDNNALNNKGIYDLAINTTVKGSCFVYYMNYDNCDVQNHRIDYRFKHFYFSRLGLILKFLVKICKFQRVLVYKCISINYLIV